MAEIEVLPGSTAKSDEVQEAAFNGALHTLDRVNDIIKSVTAYHVNQHIQGYKANLDELMIESQGFLKKGELEEGWTAWEHIESFPIRRDEDLDRLVFDSRLWEHLNLFNRWLRLKLHENHVTMVDRKEWESGIMKVRKKMGLFNG